MKNLPFSKTEIEERGLHFHALSPFQQSKAKETYQKDTGDYDEAERGWESYGYNPVTFQVTGDDFITKGELNHE